VIFVMGSMAVRPADVERLHKPIVSQIEATRAEDGCLHYSLAHDVIDPTIIRVAERWRDQAAMASHLVSDHMVRFNVDFRAAQIVSARVDSFHPGGEVRKLIDFNANPKNVPRGSKAMVIVMGTARFAPGEFERLADPMRVQIEATRAEDGCEHYSFARDPIEPDLMHITERWRDNAVIAAHFESPHMAAFNAVLAQADVRAISVKAYDETGERTLIGE
jgi:quinol monooxygenase YgiN